MDIFKGLKQFFWPDKGFLTGSVLGLAIATAIGLVYPLLLRALIDDVIAPKKFDGIMELALLAVSLIVVKAAFQYVHGFCGGRLGNKLAYRMRNASYDKLQKLSFSFYDQARTGDLMSRLTADIEGIRNFIGFGFAQLLNTLFLVLFGFGMMFYVDWTMGLMTLAIIPIIGYFAIRFELQIHPIFRSIRIAISRLTTSVQENIMGVRTVKSYDSASHEYGKFDEGNSQYKENNLSLAGVWATYFPIIEFVASFSIALLLLVGGWRVIHHHMTLGDLVSLNGMLGMIVAPLWTLGFQINNYTQSKAAGERLLELLNRHVDVQPPAHPIRTQPEGIGLIRYRDVDFRYPNHEHQPSALTGFNLTAGPGSVIGLLGGTGSGKSTVVQLLLRAYDVTSGAITLDDTDIRQLDLDELRSRTAIVFQESFLFSTTIRENISYGSADATQEQIEQAARLADAHGFIMELPGGYDTIVGERGMGLSGGQKQRIALARAFLIRPQVLILDDSTSALDMETEHRIQLALRQVMAGRTVFIIAHRISSLRHADEILVLDKGHVVQRGRHEELVRLPGLYRETYRTQYADRPDELGEDAAGGRRVSG
ncbi:ABC transporter ATP-binding protein [Cohnella hashimotonis]|uniref:ABC transporter ATP-binding protein n=1 Tax=Cohnella hashimotonis TaxID=2826895 RepID=A0ABT6TFD6_9BACL|nr:ABC transporter ATP-binding protein [Cohnella hashimotonis]MDI4645557.1 ABC transporter ATP-binding protein [Cohnella hashimotonis]